MDIYQASTAIQKKILSANKVVLATHQRPDPDAIGSLSAVSHWLTEIKKTHLAICPHEPDYNFAWLNDFRPIVTDIDSLAECPGDVLVVLDCGDLHHARLNEALLRWEKKPFIINIDHHITNTNFGDINLVVSNSASTTEILYEVFNLLRVDITPKIASSLLAGIIGDTYNFTNPNTTKKSFDITSKLLSLGASLPTVSDTVLKNKNLDMLHVWGLVLSRLKFNNNYDVAVTVLEDSDIPEELKDEDVAGGISNFLNNIGGVKAALVLQQLPDNIIKGSFRTNSDLIDVAKLAKILGGGGHRKAAGFHLSGKIEKNGESWKIV